MRNKNSYPQDVLAGLSPGFLGELELLRHEFTTRTDRLIQKITQLRETVPDSQPVSFWLQIMTDHRASMCKEMEDCMSIMRSLEEKANIGRLQQANEQVCTDVALLEKEVLHKLTLLQQMNTASLQSVFSLGLLPASKLMEKDIGTALRNGVSQQAEDMQLISNELQDLAIMLKERNKTITHPLDENHPE